MVDGDPIEDPFVDKVLAFYPDDFFFADWHT